MADRGGICEASLSVIGSSDEIVDIQCDSYSNYPPSPSYEKGQAQSKGRQFPSAPPSQYADMSSTSNTTQFTGYPAQCPPQSGYAPTGLGYQPSGTDASQHPPSPYNPAVHAPQGQHGAMYTGMYPAQPNQAGQYPQNSNPGQQTFYHPTVLSPAQGDATVQSYPVVNMAGPTSPQLEQFARRWITPCALCVIGIVIGIVILGAIFGNGIS